MKNTFKLFEAMRNIAVIALVTAIGFSMTACPPDGGKEEGGGGGTTTVSLGNSFTLSGQVYNTNNSQPSTPSTITQNFTHYQNYLLNTYPDLSTNIPDSEIKAQDGFLTLKLGKPELSATYDYSSLASNPLVNGCTLSDNSAKILLIAYFTPVELSISNVNVLRLHGNSNAISLFYADKDVTIYKGTSVLKQDIVLKPGWNTLMMDDDLNLLPHSLSIIKFVTLTSAIPITW